MEDFKEYETAKLIPNEKRKEKIKQLISEGYKYRCLYCGTWYKDYRQFCKCGSDLFRDDKYELENCYNLEVSPHLRNGQNYLIFNESHVKYCKCNVGELWTGQAEYECGQLGKWEEINGPWTPFPMIKTYKCPKSGYNIEVHRCPQEEIDQTGYFLTPVEKW